MLSKKQKTNLNFQKTDQTFIKKNLITEYRVTSNLYQ